MDRCCKCGNTSVALDYNPRTDMLDKTCMGCGYTWSFPPLDKKEDSRSVYSYARNGIMDKDDSSG